jgi:hypothetical protein
VADTTELHQLFKLPILFQHFAEHKERDSQVSLMDFLAMHYWGNDMNDDDNDRDMQLPFKKLDVHPLQVFYMPFVRMATVKPHAEPVQKNYPVYGHQYIPNPDLSSPFRPPCA